MDTFGSWPHVPLLSCEAAKSLPKKYRKSKRSGVKGLESSPGGEGMQPVGISYRRRDPVLHGLPFKRV